MIEKGKEELFEQQALQSMQTFKEALSLCPPDDRMSLGEIFFFLGLASRNLGHSEYALRCWENAAFIRDRSEDIDGKDWSIFHTIQTSRYLITKGTGQFDTIAESDMIHDLIKMVWYEIYDLEGLQQMGYYERCSYYRSIRIVFPEIGSKRISRKGQKKSQIVPFIKPKT